MKIKNTNSRWIKLLGPPVVLSLVMVLSVGLLSPQVSAAEYNQPVYDPVSKSYFELKKNNSKSGKWRVARKLATTQVYKGIRGRLAVVKTAGVHKFLRNNFKFKYWTWIGLRYWCRYRKLQWVTGEIHETSGFNPWARRWFRVRGVGCGGDGLSSGGSKWGAGYYMPVYYLPEKSAQGFSWQASGPNKGFKDYLVEYPAPEGQG